MPSMDIPIEVISGKDAAGEVVLTIDFQYRPGSPAHMGSLSYPGHPADPPEVEVETIFWPIKRWDGRQFVDDHIEMPPSGLPVDIGEFIDQHIAENYNPAEDEPDI